MPPTAGRPPTNPPGLFHDPEAAQTLLDTGRLPVRPLRPGGFIGYFAHPDEVVPLIRRAGLEVRAVLGVDALVSQIEEGVNQLSGAAWERWVDLSTRAAPDLSLYGAAETSWCWLRGRCGEKCCVVWP